MSTVHRGRAFEERCLRLLQDNLSMSLTRVGGRSDHGVDLLGWWWLPPLAKDLEKTESSSTSHERWGKLPRRRLRVLGQCKAEKKKMGPNYVREMEGVLYRHLSAPFITPIPSTIPSNDQSPLISDPTVALLISQSKFTTATTIRAMSSPIPFLLLHLPSIDDPPPDGDAFNESNQLGAAVWNRALSNDLLGGEMELRWERGLRGHAGRPALWWQRRPLEGWVPDRLQK